MSTYGASGIPQHSKTQTETGRKSINQKGRAEKCLRSHLRPVTAVSLFVVQESADAELLSRGSVPASPVACAGCLVAEDSVQPVAVLVGYRSV
jgi:hypothetical protein